ncbi:hypothetical protein BH09BAC4_BH09BAC4_30980 [soil metagenome]
MTLKVVYDSAYFPKSHLILLVIKISVPVVFSKLERINQPGSNPLRFQFLHGEIGSPSRQGHVGEGRIDATR